MPLLGSATQPPAADLRPIWRATRLELPGPVRQVPVVGQLRQWLGRRKRAWQQRRRASRQPFSQANLAQLIADDLGIVRGDTLFVHSAVAELPLDFAFDELLAILLDIVGPTGTVLFPTYPALPSLQFLRAGRVFDVRSTVSATGLLTEVARRTDGAVRSLHPTKSVCAIGAQANQLTADHDRSPYPYDACSPYYKLIPSRGKIVGLGVSSRFLSFVHTVDDALQDRFPLSPYDPELFAAKCLDVDGRPRTVATYAHDPAIRARNIPRFMRRHIDRRVCQDLSIDGVRFFRASAPELFGQMIELAARGITVYGRFPSLKGTRP